VGLDRLPDMDLQCQHSDLQSILAHGKCRHMPYVCDVVSLEEMTRYAKESCQYYCIVSSAVDWVVSVFTELSHITGIRVDYVG
jgi:hypothetical protein